MDKLKYANSNLPQKQEQKYEMINKAAAAYADFMDALKFDWRSDPNSADTPRRVAKAFVNDVIKGCYEDAPTITAFDNVDSYNGMVCQNNIRLTSLCSHHHMPFTGFAHVAYIPSKSGKVIGLSKLNRVVDWFARRPQVQENLTMQIHNFINEICTNNNGVAVMIEAKHNCCSNRGIKHDSTMRTAYMSGAFLENGDNSRAEFYKFIDYAQNRNLM